MRNMEHSDNTFAMTLLNYTLQATGTPYALNLVNAPLANMTGGTSRVIRANAIFASGPIDVTEVASYTARSGTANVFSVSPSGTILANGTGWICWMSPMVGYRPRRRSR
jgi:hypothetical protein